MGVKRADRDFLHYNGVDLMTQVSNKVENMTFDTKNPLGEFTSFGPDPLATRKINFGTLTWEEGMADVGRSRFLTTTGVYASSKFLDDFLAAKESMQGREAEPIP